jgi:hypothetical protein
LIRNYVTQLRIDIVAARLRGPEVPPISRSMIVKSVTPEQIDLLKTAKAHLAALWQASSPWADEHCLGVASASLRLLIVEENLQRA